MKKFCKILCCLLTAVLVCGMLAACGSSASGESLKIGVLQFGEFDALTNAYQGFMDGLGDAGYIDGDNITVTYKSAAGDTNNCPTIADTLVNDGSDLILAIATPSALSVMQKTTSIPILITAVTDPEASGIVASNDAPGGNVTGTSDMNPVAEQIALLTEILPDAKTVAVLYCSSESNSKIQYEMAKAALEEKGLTCVEKTISAIDEAKSAVESLVGVADAIYIPTDNTLADGMTTVSAAANSVGLPIIAGEAGMVKNGALATYGIDYYELGKQTAAMAVDILKNGADPASMPIQHQTDSNVLTIAVNTEAAAACGVTFSDDLLAKATVYPEAEG